MNNVTNEIEPIEDIEDKETQSLALTEFNAGSSTFNIP